MKLSKTKKILLLATTLTILTTSIAVPIVLLNKNNDENDVEKIFKILKTKTTPQKIIELPSSASGKIIADNQAKIIAKIKTLVGQPNLKEVKIEILKKDDTNISITPQKIIIKITKNEFSKEIEDFSVKKINPIDEEIESIKKALDAKTGNDLIIFLPSDSTGNIIGNATNKNAILKKIRELIDSSNTGGTANHASLKGASIEISINNDVAISTTPQNIIVSISKTGGKTVKTTKIFKVKKESEEDKDIMVIKQILDTKFDNNDPGLSIILPTSSRESIINNLTNKNAIERQVRKVIDPSNTNGDPNHASLRGTTITLTKIHSAPPLNDLISIESKVIIITISKSGGTSLDFSGFVVRKSRN